MLNMGYISSKVKKQNRMLGFNWKHSILITFVFLISRASIVDKLTPFGIAFITAYMLKEKFDFYILISFILGILTVHGIEGLDYIVTSVVIVACYTFISKLKEKSLILSSSITAGIFILAMSVYSMVFSDLSIYNFLIIGFEGLIVFTLTYMFSYSIEIKDSFIGTKERVIGLFITLALVLAGLGELSIYGISLKNLISIIIILYVGYKKGAFVGSTMGITLGIISYISEPQMPFILSIYGLAGLLTGVFKEQGKIGSVLGFVLGNGIMSFYINGYGISFINLKEIILSISAFAILYKPMDNLLSNFMDSIIVERKEKSYSHRKDEMTINKLNKISDVFTEIGQTFRKSIEESKSYSVKEVYEMIDCTANKVCSSCAMKKFCWNERFYNTYNSMFKVTALLEENIPLSDDTLPKAIKDYCINKESIVRELKNQYEKLKVNSMWKEKIVQNRLLVSEQLEGVSNIIKDIVKEIYVNPTFKEDVEKLVYEELKTHKVDVVDVVVAELYKENIEVYVEVNRSYKETNKKENIMKIVSETLGMPLKVEYSVDQMKGDRQRFKLIRSNRYSAFTEVFTKANNKNNISGDNHTFGEGENIYFAAISDGMGIGQKAYNESNIAINLLEKFLEAKFDKELALKTINSILMLKSNDEMFTTLDISLIDLYTGKLQLIKTGAPATFIKKKDRVEIINSQSLPVGILKDVDFNVYEEYLEDGDIIIMMSDGVFEVNEQVDNVEKWMEDVIINIDSLNPKTIGEEIMKAVTENNDIKDDMTILVTKVWKTV